MDLIMRQVPNYLLIGNGRMANHMHHYFDSLSIPHAMWNRQQTTSKLYQALVSATHILVLISDDQIEEFIKYYIQPEYSEKIIIHFSASLTLTVENTYSAHPLQSFIDINAYTKEAYEKIPFILTSGTPSLHILMPGLNNPFYYIQSSDMAYYHALCVLANNMSTILWKKFYEEMTARFQIRDKDLTPILQYTFYNIQKTKGKHVSGPLVRGDSKTLTRDLHALEEDEFYSIFKDMIDICSDKRAV